MSKITRIASLTRVWRWEPSCIAVEIQNDAATVEDSLAAPQKYNFRITV